MSKLDYRINKRLKREKKLAFLRYLSFILMINISVACIFFVDYNMNKMLNKKSLIQKNIDLIEDSFEVIENNIKKIQK